MKDTFYFLFDNMLDPVFVISAVFTITLLFSLWEGYLGNSLQKYANKLFNPVYLEFNVFIVCMFILFILVVYIGINVIYCIDEETSKNLVNVKDNNINIHNPNIYVPGSLAKAIGGIGIGGAVAGGMHSIASLTKLGGMPLGAKIIAVATGGTIAGTLFVATNAMNTIVQRGLDNSKSLNSNLSNNTTNGSENNGPYTASSMIDSGDNNSSIMDTVMDLLNSNLIINMASLSLLLALAVLFVSSKVAGKKWGLIFVKNIFGESFHKFLIKTLSFTSKYNEAWMLIIWILLVVATLGSIYIAQFLITHIDLISEIYQNSKK
jgi:hypothetical protein